MGGFRCAASHCFADQRKSVNKYPFMRDISWVKWPKDSLSVNRWKRLIRRASGAVTDQLIVTPKTRLCSRHFKTEDVNVYGEASGDPVFFLWNNWGNNICERKPSKLQRQKATAETTSLAIASLNQVTVETVTTIVPEIVSEVIIQQQDRPEIGSKCFCLIDVE